MAEFYLDVMGEMCPLPILRSANTLKEMQIGDVLVVTTDHSCAMKAITLHFRKHPVQTEVTEVARGVWKVFIRRTG